MRIRKIENGKEAKLMNLNDYVKFDDSRKQFEILTGTQGKYSYDDVIRVSVLNLSLIHI